MSETARNNSGPISFTSLLAILFIGLKLGKVIDWSWWWVLAPLWIPFAIASFVLLIVGLVYGAIWMIERKST